MVNMSASPRSGPVPNQSPIQSAPRPSVMNGMNTASASGAMAKAVSGDAAFSTSWANPNTRPWRSKGIERCSTVCSAASITGMRASHTTMPAASIQIEDRKAKTEQIVQLTRLAASRARSGLRPRPRRATTMPPAMKARLMNAHSRPQASTDTSVSP